MTHYAFTLAQARLGALQALLVALNSVANDPAEIRRIAQAIFKAPEPDDDIDASITFDDRGRTKPPPNLHARTDFSPPPPSAAAPPARPAPQQPPPPSSHPAAPPAPAAPLEPTPPTRTLEIRNTLNDELLTVCPSSNIPLPPELRPRHPHLPPAARLIAHSGRAP